MYTYKNMLESMGIQFTDKIGCNKKNQDFSKTKN